MNEGTLAVHRVELVDDAREDFSDCGGIADHAACAHDFGQISTWNNCRWLIIDATFEPCRTPVDELNGTLGLDGGHRRIDILGHNITAVHHAAGHVFAVAWITLDEHARWLEDRHCDLCDRELLIVSLLCRDDRRITGKHEVDARVGNKICLELSDVNVE